MAIINNELANVHNWLGANRLPLDIDKSNYVIFHLPQKNVVHSVNLRLKINENI